MSEESKKRTKFFTIFAAGAISLVVGVSSALLVNYFTEKRLELIYDITSAEVFEDNSQKIGILAIQISNIGRKEIENVQCRIVLKEAKITKHRSTGIPPASLTVTAFASELNAEIPFLNPKESFSLQLLVQPEGSTLLEPKLEIRGKGIIGTRKSLKEGTENKYAKATIFFGSFATILALYLSLSVIRRTRPSAFDVVLPRASALSEEDQRDEFAYLLGINGFITEANILRKSSRDQRYWSLADSFTQQLMAIRPQDTEALGSAVRVLEQLLEYSEGMAPSSKAIVKLNAALLAQASGSDAKAANLVHEARECHSLTVGQRLKVDNRLKVLSESEAEKG